MAGSLMRFLMIGDQMEQVSISSRKITLADWPAIVEGLPCLVPCVGEDLHWTAHHWKIYTTFTLFHFYKFNVKTKGFIKRDSWYKKFGGFGLKFLHTFCHMWIDNITLKYLHELLFTRWWQFLAPKVPYDICQNCQNFPRSFPIFRTASQLSGFFQIISHFPDSFTIHWIFPDHFPFTGQC